MSRGAPCSKASLVIATTMIVGKAVGVHDP
jgi:hypothetical protein